MIKCIENVYLESKICFRKDKNYDYGMSRGTHGSFYEIIDDNNIIRKFNSKDFNLIFIKN